MDFSKYLRALSPPLGAPLHVLPLQGDASTRRYYRIVLPEGTCPQTLIAMVLPDDPLKSDEALAQDAPDELPFLNVHREMATHRLPVPKIYGHWVSERVVLLADLGDTTLAAQVTSATPNQLAAWYEAAVDLAVEMHRAMGHMSSDCIAASRRFDRGLLRWELDHFYEWGVAARLNTTPSRAKSDRLARVFDELADEIAGLPVGFVHRDFQSRNLMVVGEKPQKESLAIIDFQDALKGPRIYDLVALMNDSYVDLPGPLKRRLIDRYAAQTGVDAAILTREFHLVSVQRKLKDGGRFVYIDRVKGNPSYLPYVERSFVRARQSLAQLDGFEALKALLAQSDPEIFRDLTE